MEFAYENNTRIIQKTKKKGYIPLFLILALGSSAQAPVVSFTNSPNQCSGQNILFTDQSTNAPSSWAWSFPGGNPSTSSVQNPTVTYAAAGVYTVTHGASITNFTGTAVTQTIYVAASPTVTISSSTNQVCPWETVTLTASGANTYTWNPGAFTGSVVIASVPSTTIFNVVGATGSCTTAASTLVIALSAPSTTPFPQTVYACGAAPSATVSVQPLPGATYIWSTGNTTSSFVVTPPVNQTYTCYTKTNILCNISIIQLTVQPNPTVTVNSGSICAGSQTVLCASGASGYLWMPATGLSYTLGPCVTASPLTSINYTVLGSTALCSGSTIVSVNVLPGPTLVTTPIATLCPGESQNICVTGANSYTWVLIPGLNSYTVNCPVASPLISTNYVVTGLGNNGCAKSTTITISVDPCLGIEDQTGADKSMFEIFPNPNAGNFSIQLSRENGWEEFQLYNSLGEKIYTCQLNFELNEIALKILPGIYYARIINAENATTMKKMVVE
ncbi:MAG TPA: T9SS type A sorting domain-containing protein [Bacteroidia bacterium]|nr:T9SS type A sorting domain-containing protein [Bacteroidia bacterium]